MSAICQCMVQDFMLGTGRVDDAGHEYYDERDLENGIDYAETLIADGYKREPFHKYDLRRFIAWARRKRALLLARRRTRPFPGGPKVIVVTTP